MNKTVKMVAIALGLLVVVYVGFGLYAGVWSVDYSKSEAAYNRNPGDPSGGGGAGNPSPWYCRLYFLPC